MERFIAPMRLTAVAGGQAEAQVRSGQEEGRPAKSGWRVGWRSLLACMVDTSKIFELTSHHPSATAIESKTEDLVPNHLDLEHGLGCCVQRSTARQQQLSVETKDAFNV